MNEPELNGPLWGELEIQMGHGLRWDLGSFQLFVLRQEGEWQIAHGTTPSEETGPGIWQVTEISEALPDELTLSRFASGGATSIVQLVPRAADRSVVAKPHPPLHLLAQEDTKIYVSSPVWVEVTVGRRVYSLCELPVRRLSDTWFGHNTREGDVAYALRTRARVRLAEMPMRAYRIITPVTIRNKSQDSLLIDRMNLPVPYLSVYASQDGFLWTESVTLTRSEGADLDTLEIGKGPPREVDRANRLSEPRRDSDANFLVRAFTSLFDSLQGEN